jgi:predicted ATP-dependent protease
MSWKETRFEDLAFPYKLQIGTKDVAPQEVFPHQGRVEKAFNLALGLDDEGYNVYVCGIPGVGRTTYTLRKVKEVARSKPTPQDVCYVNNFDDPVRPKALIFPPGKGKRFVELIENALEFLKRETFRAFEGKEYEEEIANITKSIDKKKEEVIQELTEKAKEHNLMVLFSPQGVRLLPLFRIETPVSEEELLKDPRIRAEYQKNIQEFEPIMREYMRRLRDLDAEFGDALINLRNKIAEELINRALEDLFEEFKDLKEVIEYLRSLKKELVKNIQLFIEWEKAKGNLMAQSGINRALNIFRTNLLVDNSKLKGAPVVYEKVPTLKGLFGQINYRAEMGILYADHLSLTPGSLHKANGGYLILDLWEVLKNPALYFLLKRTIKHGKLFIMGGMMEEIPVPHVGLSPEPISFSAKVFLIGDPYLYYLLTNYDEEFSELFKIKAEFDANVPVDEEFLSVFPSIVKKIIVDKKLKDLTPEALTEVLKFSIYEAGNLRKARFNFADLSMLLQEANAYAEGDFIEASHIKRAIREKIYRLNLIEEKILELIKNGKIIISVEGKKVGQINGLSVLSLGDYSFGKPSRITATVYPGSKGVVHIEREIDLSGPIHSKGVYILSSYLFHKYSGDFPLQLSATLTFEQGYDFVEGDSASAAELLALLSAIAKVPLRQDLAITGSIDQFGNIQPVGGIKEKVEGFFKVCKQTKMSGTQGVIIPVQNYDEVLLDEEVLSAIKEGTFHLYQIEHIDDAIELLTGMKPDKFHKKVKEALKNFYEITKEVEKKKPKKTKKTKKKAKNK